MLKTLLALYLRRYMMPLFELAGHYSLSSQRFTRAQQCAGVDGALRSGRDTSWRNIHPTSRSALVALSRWRRQRLWQSMGTRRHERWERGRRHRRLEQWSRKEYATTGRVKVMIEWLLCPCPHGCSTCQCPCLAIKNNVHATLAPMFVRSTSITSRPYQRTRDGAFVTELAEQTQPLQTPYIDDGSCSRRPGHTKKGFNKDGGTSSLDIGSALVKTRPQFQEASQRPMSVVAAAASEIFNKA